MDLDSLDFVVNRFSMKLFHTNNIDTVKECQMFFFCFEMPSTLLKKRVEKFQKQYQNDVNGTIGILHMACRYCIGSEVKQMVILFVFVLILVKKIALVTNQTTNDVMIRSIEKYAFYYLNEAHKTGR